MACIALAAMAWSGAFDLDQSAGEKKTPYSPEYDDTFFAKYETPISDEPEEYFEVGIEMLKTGEIDRAIKAFENAEEAGHDKASVQYNLGCCWAKKADKDKAFSYFNRAIDNGYLNTEHFLVDEDLISLRSDKRFDNAASRMDAIINADEFVAAGIEEANNQRFEQAVILQQQALKLVPEHEKAVLNLGYAFHMLGKYDKAIKWHKKAAASDQYAALGNYNLSCIHSQRNELDLAIKHFDTAVDRKLSRNLDRDSIVADTDLDNLRGDVRFAASMKKFQDSEHRLKHTHTMSFNRGYGSIVTSATSSDYDPELLYVSGPVNGTWNGDIKGGTIQLSILRSIEGSDCRWGYLDNYNLDQFTPEISESLNKFSLIKPQGTIEFVGNFNNQNGSGKFKFQGDDDYQAQLASKGIESITEALLFRLFFSRDNEQKVLADLQELQNLDLDEETRQVLMIAGIPTGLVKEYQEADLDVKQHLRFILTRVHCRMILEYNRAKLDLDDHKEFIDQRVPASLLVSYTDAGLDLEGHSNFIASRVDAKFLKEYKDAGLSLNRFNGFINQRVSARFLKSYLDAGFDLDRFQNFINWRVEPKFLESYIEKGLEPEKYSKFINQRVPAATLGGYLDGELSLKTYGSFVKNHVPADLVLSYKKAGFDPIKYKWFIQQRIESRFLARYQAAGLDIEEHREFIRDRVEPAKILRFRKSRSKKK